MHTNFSKSLIAGAVTLLSGGSIAGDEYIHDLHEARLADDGTVQWVETCFCTEPLQDERPYWEEFFELLSVEDGHDRKNCKHENGSRPFACSDCDCTRKLEWRLKQTGKPFLETLEATSPNGQSL